MRRTHRILAVVAAAGALATNLTGCEPGPSPWSAELLTRTASGSAAGLGGNYLQEGAFDVSADGTTLAFITYSPDLGPEPVTGDSPYLYVHSFVTGETTLASVNAAGTDAGDGGADQPTLSADGTKVAFRGWASDLVPDDTGNTTNVFVRDLTTGTTTLVSAAAAPGGADGPSASPQISPDGTKVAFVSYAGNLGPTDSHRPDENAQGGDTDIYLRDLTTGTTTLLSDNAAGTDSGNRRSESPVFSPDGSEVAFVSAAGNLGPTDSTRVGYFADEDDVYVHDLASGTLSLASANATGTDSGSGPSSRYERPAFSPDGSRVLFMSEATDLGPTDSGRYRDLYLRDLTTGATSLVSANAANTDGANQGAVRTGQFSPDGSKVLYTTSSTDLGPTDDNGQRDTYLRDLTTGTQQLISVTPDGEAGNAISDAQGFSPDGTKILFTSGASDLGAKDTNQLGDLYARDLVTGTTTLISARAGGADGSNGSTDFAYTVGSQGVTSTFAFVSDNRHVAFVTEGSNFGASDSNGGLDIYVATLHGADLRLSGAATPEPVGSGDQLTFDLHLANHGPEAATGIGVGVVLPDGVTFDAATSSSGSCTAPTAEHPHLVPCTVGTLASGGAVDIGVTVTVTAASGSSLTTTAVAVSSAIDPASTNNQVTIASHVA